MFYEVQYYKVLFVLTKETNITNICVHFWDGAPRNIGLVLNNFISTCRQCDQDVIDRKVSFARVATSEKKPAVISIIVIIIVPVRYITLLDIFDDKKKREK